MEGKALIRRKRERDRKQADSSSVITRAVRKRSKSPDKPSTGQPTRVTNGKRKDETTGKTRKNSPQPKKMKNLYP